MQEITKANNIRKMTLDKRITMRRFYKGKGKNHPGGMIFIYLSNICINGKS